MISKVSITKIGIEYAHRFLGYEGEAQYLHGHHGEFDLSPKHQPLLS